MEIRDRDIITEVTINVFSGNVDGQWEEVWCGTSEMKMTFPAGNISRESVFHLTKSQTLPTNIKGQIRCHVAQF